MDCIGNCYKCFNGSEQECISCNNDYTISGNECKLVTGYYLTIPTNNPNSHDRVILNEDISSYKEITLIFYMKFLGSIEQRSGIVPILYFYQDKNYLGWNIENEGFIINILDESLDTPENVEVFLFNNSRLYIGKWSLFSISISISDYQLQFPNMIQLMIDDNIIQPSIDLTNLHKLKILFDYISINNKMSAVFHDLRIFNKFFIGAYGIGQEINIPDYSSPFLIRRFPFYSTSENSNDCLSNDDTNPSIGAYNPKFEITFG